MLKFSNSTEFLIQNFDFLSTFPTTCSHCAQPNEVAWLKFHSPQRLRGSSPTTGIEEKRHLLLQSLRLTLWKFVPLVVPRWNMPSGSLRTPTRGCRIVFHVILECTSGDDSGLSWVRQPDNQKNNRITGNGPTYTERGCPAAGPVQ